MVAPVHVGEAGLRHVAVDAVAARRAGLVMGVGRGVRHPFLVTGQTGAVGVLRREPVAPAGRVAVDAVELAAADAGAHQPAGVGVVFSEIAAVRIVVGIFESHQVVVIEEPLGHLVAGADRTHLGVTRRAHFAPLLDGELRDAQDAHVLVLRSGPSCRARRGRRRRRDTFRS